MNNYQDPNSPIMVAAYRQSQLEEQGVKDLDAIRYGVYESILSYMSDPANMQDNGLPSLDRYPDDLAIEGIEEDIEMSNERFFGDGEASELLEQTAKEILLLAKYDYLTNVNEMTLNALNGLSL